MSDKNIQHLTPAQLTHFAALWCRDPETIADDEFFLIETHLLQCEKCAAAAKAYEDRAEHRISNSGAAA